MYFSSSCSHSGQKFISFSSYKASHSSFNSHTYGGSLFSSFGYNKQRRNVQPLLLSSIPNYRRCQFMHLGLSSRCRSICLRLWLPLLKNEKIAKINWNPRHTNWNVRPTTWLLGGGSAGFCSCFSSSGPLYAESGEENDESQSPQSSSHGKKVYKDYSITGIPGDGRCLFRSVAHGACIRAGKPMPDEKLQRKLADELREHVAEEFIRRRTETEWFIEGDFDMYVSRIRKPHVWGGEPELLMASHVLKMPITVYMHDKDSGGLIAIAEYGQEYGKENPIEVLYHGFGHYDALQIPRTEGARSRL